MSNTITFYFDFVSPYSYLAQTQMAKLTAQTGARIEYVPVFMGGIYQEQGIKAPASNPNKAAWINKDCRLWAKHYDVEFAWVSPFPFNSISLLRAVLWLQAKQPESVQKFIESTFNAIWQGELDVTSESHMVKHVTGLGIDAQSLFAGIQEDSIKQQLKDNVALAVEKGFFGLPGFTVGSELFFGQDRLMFVKDAYLAQQQ
jgi:2-hydroxychromene-2-carboxylate isomerase